MQIFVCFRAVYKYGTGRILTAGYSFEISMREEKRQGLSYLKIEKKAQETIAYQIRAIRISDARIAWAPREAS
ncbi:hypothetical protein KPHES18084_11020 [Corynebacterium ulcerans]|nr:hypothetical protein CULTSU28_12080 [Corynebacterium ulcerans]